MFGAMQDVGWLLGLALGWRSDGHGGWTWKMDMEDGVGGWTWRMGMEVVANGLLDDYKYYL